MSKSDFGSFLVGMGVGAVAAMLFAPQAGSETRGMIAGKAGESRDYLRHQSGNIRDSAGELVQRGRELVNRQRDHLREALDAGKQAYHETVDRPPDTPQAL
jgi:gas vesicle protein